MALQYIIPVLNGISFILANKSKFCMVQFFVAVSEIIRYRSLEILYYKLKINQTSTDIPAQDHFPDTSTSEKSV